MNNEKEIKSNIMPVPKHNKYVTIKNLCHSRLPIYLFGPTGSGKTAIFRDIAAELNVTFYKKLIGAQMTEASLLGYMDANGRYVEGIVYKPYTEGGLLVLDEIDNGNPNTNLVVNGVCDLELAFPIGMRQRHKDFIVVATANTTGHGATLQYVGRNKLDAAMLNRFVFVEFDYDLFFELKLAQLEYDSFARTKNYSLFESSVHDFWRVRRAITNLGLTHILSMRNLLQQTRMLALGFTKKEILEYVIMRNLSKEQQNKILENALTIKLAEIKPPPFVPTAEEESQEIINIEKELKAMAYQERQNWLSALKKQIEEDFRHRKLEPARAKRTKEQSEIYAKSMEYLKKEGKKELPNIPNWDEIIITGIATRPTDPTQT